MTAPFLSSACVLMGLEPANDAILEFAGLGSHGSAVAGGSRFPKGDFWITAFAGRENHLRVVRRHIIVDEAVNQEGGYPTHGYGTCGIDLSQVDAIFAARIEDAEFDNRTK